MKFHLRRRGLMLAGVYVTWGVVATVVHGSLIYPFGPHQIARAGYELTVVGDAHIYATPIQSDPVVLYFMGNGGALTYFEPILAVHEAENRSVVALQYPGGGGISGTPSETVLKALALNTYDWVSAQTDAKIVVHGTSMGTSLAQYVAANREVTAVILDAPFVRMCEVMTRKALLPACYMPFVQRWDSAVFADQITAPVLIQHGTDDTLIPATDGARLAKILVAAGVEAQFVEQANAGHETLQNAAAYGVTITDFLTGALQSQ